MALTPSVIICCTSCNTSLQEALFNSTFWLTLATIAIAFVVLGLVAEGVVKLYASIQSKKLLSKQEVRNSASFIRASIIIGMGVGGFIDGIVFHQLLQWHQMLSYQLPPTTLLTKSVNMFWDGVFHAFTLLTVCIGIILLRSSYTNHPPNANNHNFYNGIIVGWGVFNIGEGIYNHHILKLHNVREVTEHVEMWNWGFLFLSVLLVVTGFTSLSRRSIPSSV